MTRAAQSSSPAPFSSFSLKKIIYVTGEKHKWRQGQGHSTWWLSFRPLPRGDCYQDCSSCKGAIPPSVCSNFLELFHCVCVCECVRACASTYTQDLCTSLTWGDDCAGVTLGRKASSLGFAGAGPTWGRAWAPLEWMMKMRAKPPLWGTPFLHWLAGFL